MEGLSRLIEQNKIIDPAEVSEELAKSKVALIHESVNSNGESLTPLFKVLAEQLIGPLGFL